MAIDLITPITWQRSLPLENGADPDMDEDPIESEGFDSPQEELLSPALARGQDIFTLFLLGLATATAVFGCSNNAPGAQPSYDVHRSIPDEVELPLDPAQDCSSYSPAPEMPGIVGATLAEEEEITSLLNIPTKSPASGSNFPKSLT